MKENTSKDLESHLVNITEVFGRWIFFDVRVVGQVFYIILGFLLVFYMIREGHVTYPTLLVIK